MYRKVLNYKLQYTTLLKGFLIYFSSISRILVWEKAIIEIQGTTFKLKYPKGKP